MVGSCLQEMFGRAGDEREREASHFLLLETERRVHLEDEGHTEVPCELETGCAEQAVPLVDHIGLEALQRHPALHFETEGIQQIAKIFGQTVPIADLLRLQSRAQLSQRGANR